MKSVKFSEEEKNCYMQKLERHMEALRFETGLSQAAISEMAGFSRQTYCMAVSGQKHLSWRNLLALLYVFEKHEASARRMRELDLIPEKFIEAINAEQLDRRKKRKIGV